MRPLRVGLIGCGRIAHAVHLKTLVQSPGVLLAGVAEPDSQRREKARLRARGITGFAEYQQLLEQPDLDAVVACLPSHLHADVAMAALHHGKAIYLEKPLATEVTHADEVLRMWQRRPVTAMIGFNYRFHPLYQEAKRRLASGALGELVAVRTVFSSAARALPEWKRTRATGGVLLDLASRHVDLIHYLFDEPLEEVFAATRSQRADNDSAILHLRLTSGLLAQIFVSLSSVEEDRVEIYGQSARLIADRHAAVQLEFTPSLPRSHVERIWGRIHPMVGSRQIITKCLHPGYDPSFAAALSEFLNCARAKRPVRPDFRDVYRSLAVVIAVEESARSATAVKVEKRVHASSSCE